MPTLRSAVLLGAFFVGAMAADELAGKAGAWLFAASALFLYALADFHSDWIRGV